MARISLLFVVLVTIIATLHVADSSPMKPKIPLKYFKCANLVFEEETDPTYIECKEVKKVADEDAYNLRQMQRKYIALLEQIQKIKTKTADSSNNEDPELEQLIIESQRQYEELMAQIQKYNKVAKDFERIVGEDYYVFKLDAQNIEAPPKQ